MRTGISNLSHRGIFALLFAAFVLIFVACNKMDSAPELTEEKAINEQEVVSAARQLETTAAASAAREGAELRMPESDPTKRESRNLVEIALSNSNFSTLVAAVVKAGLEDALANPSANLTVFAPTNAAFSQLPAPFNNASNINSISDPGQISFLQNVLLYHVLGTEVRSNQISNGQSSATTLKSRGASNDNTIYFSRSLGLIRVNGRSDIIWANVNASNGILHVINKVLLFPTNNIAEVALSDSRFSALVAALVKTNLVDVFTGEGDFTVFAPTNSAFAKLPAPFNTAENIAAINNPAQINALSNILRYHVTGSRYFNWDFGILKRITTLANAPKNKITTVLGYNTGWAKGDNNNLFIKTDPGDILTTNGVVHVLGTVLLPKN